MTQNDNDGNGGGYKVGYGRPPQASRFKKGQSGNPKGKAKGTKSLAETILGAANTVITITESGKRRKVTKLEAALMQISNRAAAGDLRAANLLLAIAPAAEAKVEGRQTDQPANESDKDILRAFALRIKNFKEDDSHE